MTYCKGKEEVSHLGGLGEGQAQSGPEPGGWEGGEASSAWSAQSWREGVNAKGWPVVCDSG